MESDKKRIKEEYEKNMRDKEDYVVVAYALEKNIENIWVEIATIDAYITITKQGEIEYPKNLFLEVSAEAIINDMFIGIGSCLDSDYVFVKDGKYRRYNCSFNHLKQLVENSDNRLLQAKRIINRIDSLMQLYEERYKDIRDKIIAHNDLERIFDHEFYNITIEQIIEDFKKICIECYDIICLCFSCASNKNYEGLYEDMLFSLNAITGKSI